jgi:hypothetical protein
LALRILSLSVRALCIAALTDAWVAGLPLPVHLDFLLYPGVALLLKLIHSGMLYEPRYVLPSAWAYGLLALLVDAISFLPFTLAALYCVEFSKSALLTLRAALLLGGGASAVLGLVFVSGILNSWDYPLSTCFELFFVYLPMAALGAVVAVDSFKALKDAV